MKIPLFFVVLLAAVLQLRAADAQKPNFLVIMGEAQGWASMSTPMDDAVPESRSPLAKTPALDRLAAGGMRFANFYAASPRCTPTRAALFTGRSPAALGMTFVGEGKGGRESTFNGEGSRLLPPEFTSEMPEKDATVAELLHRTGYATAHFGKWHVGRANPSVHGFEENDGPNNNGGPENVENPNPKQAFGITEKGMDFMARQVNAGKPFYLQVSHYAGRGAGGARPETYSDVRRRMKPGQERLAELVAVAEDMDATVGQLLAKLDALGIAGNTYVIYTADHGSQGRDVNGPLTGGKGSVWEGGIRVPLVVRGPGVKAGACSQVRASTVDILPTMTALAGVREKLSAQIEGGSLAQVLSGAAAASVSRSREELVIHFPHYDKDGAGPASAILSGNDKLVRIFETDARRLFDLSKDRSERNDLAKDAPARVAELDGKLTKYLEQVGGRLPVKNPSFDPAKAGSSGERKGGMSGGGKGGGGKGGAGKGGKGGEAQDAS
jgi:arylsulfatase A